MNINTSDTNASSTTTLIRLILGMLQGLTLYFLYYSAINDEWPKALPTLFTCLVSIATLTPILIISALGHFSTKNLLLWASSITIILTLLIFYDHWRLTDLPITFSQLPIYISPLLGIFILIGFFIAHSMVFSGAQDKQYIASYPTYFENSWKLLIQFQFSACFVFAIWLTLSLGVALFSLLKLHFLSNLIRQPWFFIPFTTISYAYGIHLTDVKPAIVRGIRNLLLTLHSWTLPLAVILIGSFLIALPFTGLSNLWATRHAAAILLAATIMLISLINTAFQNGLGENELTKIIKWNTHLACLLLLPLVSIAAYALLLRISDYGWTDDRIAAACCIFIAAFYAIGYFWAACQKGQWLHGITTINISAAFIILTILLAIFSPILDPARISVTSQMARLHSGKESPEKFDYNYLRFNSARFGQIALKKLATTKDGTNAHIIQEKAQAALLKKTRWEARNNKNLKAVILKDNLESWPIDKKIPKSFLQQSWSTTKDKKLPACLLTSNTICKVYFFDYDGDNIEEILLIPTSYGESELFKLIDMQWQPIITLGYLSGCKNLLNNLKNGDIHTVTAEIPDIKIGDTYIQPKKVQSSQQRCR